MHLQTLELTPVQLAVFLAALDVVCDPQDLSGTVLSRLVVGWT